MKGQGVGVGLDLPLFRVLYNIPIGFLSCLMKDKGLPHSYTGFHKGGGDGGGGGGGGQQLKGGPLFTK